MVGKRAKKAREAYDTRSIREVGQGSSDEEAPEQHLPEYLKERKTRTDKRMNDLKEAGLRLPPRYDDVYFSDDERLEELDERPNFPRTKKSANYEDVQLPYSAGIIPAPIAQWLRSYQVEGASFLHKLFVYQEGGILGDDMGLGKTIQVIAFLTAAFGKTGDYRDAKRMRKMRRASGAPWYPRVIVICPGTLIQNWRAEFQRWGWWQVDVYHGDTKEAALEAAASGRLEIMITTYATYRMGKSEVNMVEWDCMIADECHQLKNQKSETTQALNEINALCRIGLTGTAIQNNYDELWTLLNWTNPGKFGPLGIWTKKISDPLRTGQSHDATIYQLSVARKTAKKLVENLLPRFFLRRMKTLIAHQLPKKSDRVVFCPLTETQAEAYENFLNSEVVEIIKGSYTRCGCGSGKNAGNCCYTHTSNGVKWQAMVFPAIFNLQRIANHLGLLIPQSSDPHDKQSKDLAMLEIALPDQCKELYDNRDSILNYSKSEFCGKWKILKKLLHFWHAHDDKVLVFSHSVRLLKMLQSLFTHTSYNVSYLDGSMSYEDRAKTVDDFNSDSSQFVFLISTKAGGVGLNIVSANKVVIVDPNWNPSYDLQAQDRAYRIGQARDVEVFRLVSAGTIEEIVYARQIYKQQQANIGYTASTERRYFKGVQQNKDQKGEIFGLANLFAYAGDNVVLRNIVNKTNVAESKAGVSVIGFDSTLGDDEDNEAALKDTTSSLNPEDETGAMSQLSELIKSGEHEDIVPKATHKAVKKADPISSILAHAGVTYTHENSEVIGSSRVEASLSRRAEAVAAQGGDIALAEQHVFASTQDRVAKIDVKTEARIKKERMDDSDEQVTASETDGEAAGRGADEIDYVYHPPQDVMKRQFCSMASHFGFEDATSFALVVEGWTQAKRRDCLEKFYRARREALAGKKN